MKIYLVVLCLFIWCFALADAQYRVMTYNALDLDDNSTDRTQYFTDVLSYADPDIIVMQEIINSGGANLMLNTLQQIDPSFSASQFIDGFDTDNMLFFKSADITLISQDTIQTALRDISEYILEISGNYLYIYSCHLKASQGYEQQRLQEILVLRDHLQTLPAGSEYLICGDMNFYSSSEPAYQNLTVTTPLIGEDLSDQVGSWHNNSAYSSIHTQATRYDPLSSGAYGGLDDRFDFILSSHGFNDNANFEFSGNYQVLGNDGNHFNQAVNNGTNSSVPAYIADALFYASDHLPVYIDITNTDGSPPSGDIFISEYIEGSSYNKALELYNPTQDPIILNNYDIRIYFNGSASPGQTLSLSGTIDGNDVFVICHSSADAQIMNQADITWSQLNFNGDDAVGLFKNDLQIDAIGEIGNDPGSGWDVAGINNGTKDHTLVRKETISQGNTDWTSSAGTNSTDSEWTVYDQNEFSYLGSHSAYAPQITILQPNGGENWERLHSYEIQWQSQDLTDDVKIEILDVQTSESLVLTANTSNDGSWQWQIPYTFERSEDYKIIISAANDDELSDESDAVFSVEGVYTIPEVQTTADSGFGASPLQDQTVELTGIVTGVASNNFFLQDAPGAWHGIYVYDNSSVSPGDSIFITGTVQEYFDKTELAAISELTLISSNNMLPDATQISTNEVNTEQYEGVLVCTEQAECTDDDLGYGEWEVNDGSGSCVIDDLMFAFTPTVGNFYNITGVVDYSYNSYKIEPRDAADISPGQLETPQNVSITTLNGNITLSWAPVTNADHYKIYSDTAPDGSFDTLEAENIINTTWTDPAVSGKKFYRVIAVKN